MTPKEKSFLWYISRELLRWLSIWEWPSPAATLAIVFSSENDRGLSVAGGAGGIHLYSAIFPFFSLFVQSGTPADETVLPTFSLLYLPSSIKLLWYSPELCLLVILHSLELTEKINYHRCHSLGNTKKIQKPCRCLLEKVEQKWKWVEIWFLLLLPLSTHSEDPVNTDVTGSQLAKMSGEWSLQAPRWQIPPSATER